MGWGPASLAESGRPGSLIDPGPRIDTQERSGDSEGDENENDQEADDEWFHGMYPDCYS